MTIDELKAAIPKLKALADGKAIEKFSDGRWGTLYASSLGVVANAIIGRNQALTRIKAEVKYRPWSMEEVPVGKVVRWKESGDRAAITAVSKGYILVELNWFPAEHYYDYFTMDDGSPCGVAVGE